VGGDLKNNASFRDDYRKGEPTRAGYTVIDVNGKGQRHPDITLPVAWAMGLEKESIIKNRSS
jgi:hypothetical protein